ncbi:MAG: hypothetical protein AABW86_02915 [Candidatus Micrarchaeota archaeon]
MLEEANGQFAVVKYDLGSHVINVRLKAHAEAAHLYKIKEFAPGEQETVILILAKDLVHPEADIRKSAKDALCHAFNSSRAYGLLATALGQSNLADVIEFAMEGLKSQIEEIHLACRFFIGKIIDECTIERLRDVEMALLVSHSKLLKKYGTDKDITLWKPEIEMRRREIYCGISGEESGIRRAGLDERRRHLRIIKTG